MSASKMHLMNSAARTNAARRVCVVAAAGLALLGGIVACTDVTVQPKSSINNANVFNDTLAYRSLLAKIYAGFAVTSQTNAVTTDIQGIDAGFSQYLRLLWQMQELPTDESALAWGDGPIQELNSQTWTSANDFLAVMYYRIYQAVTLSNELLRQTGDAELAARGQTGLAPTIATYRAEARYLRALAYFHAIDLFGNVPLVTEKDAIGGANPTQATRAEVFAYAVSELEAIRSALPASVSGSSAVYGRATQGAADMLLAKLYLNAAVYAGTPRYTDAVTAASRLINSGAFSLDAKYPQPFLADNNKSPELVFVVTQDGKNTQSYGGTTFLMHASCCGSLNNNVQGHNGGWSGLRAKPELIALFNAVPTSDSRTSLVYSSGQTLNITNLTNFSQGYLITKFRNVTSTGVAGSDGEFSDIDYPMFRLGDAYLMYAEAVLRGGGGSRATALAYVNALRTRANGNTATNITDAELTLDFLLDERGRELYWEGHRRTDLVRFGKFTGGSKLWTFKGNVAAGTATAAFRDLYPLPASELVANPNLKQNSGY